MYTTFKYNLFTELNKSLLVQSSLVTRRYADMQICREYLSTGYGLRFSTESTGENGFPRIPAGMLFCSCRSLRTSLEVHGMMHKHKMLRMSGSNWINWSATTGKGPKLVSARMNEGCAPVPSYSGVPSTSAAARAGSSDSASR